MPVEAQSSIHRRCADARSLRIQCNVNTTIVTAPYPRGGKYRHAGQRPTQSSGGRGRLVDVGAGIHSSTYPRYSPGLYCRCQVPESESVASQCGRRRHVPKGAEREIRHPLIVAFVRCRALADAEIAAVLVERGTVEEVSGSLTPLNRCQRPATYCGCVAARRRLRPRI